MMTAAEQSKVGAVPVFQTVGGRATFTLRVLPKGLEYKPEFTLKERLHTHKFMQRILDRYLKSGSLRPGDYSDISKNASYFLAVVGLFTGRSR